MTSTCVAAAGAARARCRAPAPGGRSSASSSSSSSSSSSRRVAVVAPARAMHAHGESSGGGAPAKDPPAGGPGHGHGGASSRPRPGEKKGFVEEMRFVAMKLHTREQAPKEGEAKPPPESKPMMQWEPTREKYLAYLVESKAMYEAMEEIVASKASPIYEAFLGAFYLTLVPIRPRSRGERRSLRTFAVVSLRPPHAFNLRPRRLSTPTDAFQLHPHVRSYGMALRHRARAHFPAREGHRVVREDVRTDRAGRGRPGGGVRQLFKGAREDEPAGVHLPLLQRLLRALRGGANDRTQGAFYYHTGPRTTASAW